MSADEAVMCDYSPAMDIRPHQADASLIIAESWFEDQGMIPLLQEGKSPQLNHAMLLPMRICSGETSSRCAAGQWILGQDNAPMVF